jgi:erythromycin esterase-like protein
MQTGITNPPTKTRNRRRADHAQAKRISHYFKARLPEQFDAVLHIDQTHALEPYPTAL